MTGNGTRSVTNRRFREVGNWKLKPLVRASRGVAFVRRTSFSISRSLEEELFRVADVLSEGSCRTSRSGANSYFGSTMITFDLSQVAKGWLGQDDSGVYQRLADAVEGSVRIRLRALRIAYREVVQRVPERPSGPAQVETTVRLNGNHLHLDVDLEVPLEIGAVIESK